MQSKDGVVKQAMSLIKNGMTVGLGGGSTVALLAKSIHKSHLEQIRIVTLSEETKSVCTQLGFVVEDFNEVSKIHYAFDGCDRVDRQFQALKTKGGIQTQEKIVAFLAEKYILFADEEKFSDYLTFDLPICCEILPNSLPVVKSALKQANATITIRQQEDNEPIKLCMGIGSST
ncbi:ribose 5-phosphate isomerase A [Niallia nealsonii AAU1]|nr:ribose 5-phosphate isomerase A [Niallia nealsonii AAU1]